MDNTYEITDFASQVYKLYLTNEVNKEINNKITVNFSSTNTEQKERTELLLRLVNRVLAEIAKGNCESTDITIDEEYFADVIDGDGNIVATIIYSPISNDEGEMGFVVTRIVWKTYVNNWWNIVESKIEMLDSVITETINSFLRRELLIL